MLRSRGSGEVLGHASLQMLAQSAGGRLNEHNHEQPAEEGEEHDGGKGDGKIEMGVPQLLRL